MNEPTRPNPPRTGAGVKGGSPSMGAAAPNAPPPLAQSDIASYAHSGTRVISTQSPCATRQLGTPTSAPLAAAHVQQQRLLQALRQPAQQQPPSQSLQHPSYSAAAENICLKAGVAPSAYAQSAYSIGSYATQYPTPTASTSATAAGTPTGGMDAVNGHGRAQVHGSAGQPQCPDAQSTPISGAASTVRPRAQSPAIMPLSRSRRIQPTAISSSTTRYNRLSTPRRVLSTRPSPRSRPCRVAAPSTQRVLRCLTPAPTRLRRRPHFTGSTTTHRKRT